MVASNVEAATANFNSYFFENSSDMQESIPSGGISPADTPFGASIEKDSNGKYVVAGSSKIDKNYDLVLWRFNEDGTLDTTFNNPNGYVTFDRDDDGLHDDQGFDLQIQSDGKYVVSGASVSSSSCDMTIWRFNQDGTLDTTFNSTGYVTHHNSAGGDSGERGMSLQIQSDGKYIVGGHSYSSVSGEEADMVIWRYNSDGTMDETFGDGTCNNGVGDGGAYGCVVHRNAAGGDYGWDKGLDIKIQSDGKYVVAGKSFKDFDAGGGTRADMVIWRYNSDGTMDDTFGDGTCNNGVGDSGAYGCTVFDSGGTIFCDKAWNLLIQDNGKLFVAGQTEGASDSDLTLWRYNSDGTLDTNFGGTGYVTHDNAAGGLNGDRPHNITRQKDGKYVIFGRSNIFGVGKKPVVWRYNDDGTLDETFGDGSCSNGVGVDNNYGCMVLSDFNIDTQDVWNTNGGDILLDGTDYILVSRPFTDSTSTDLALWKIDNLYQIISSEEGFDVKVDGLSIKQGSETSVSGRNSVLVEKNGTYIAELMVDMYTDHDWSGVTSGADINNKKSFIHGLSGVTGPMGTFSLFVPKSEGDNTVGICSGAESLDQVSENCDGFEMFSEGDENVSVVTLGEQTYWKISNLSGTGGLSLFQAAETEGSEDELTDTGTSIVSSILFVGSLLVGTRIINKRKYQE